MKLFLTFEALSLSATAGTTDLRRLNSWFLTWALYFLSMDLALAWAGLLDPPATLLGLAVAFSVGGSLEKVLGLSLSA